MDKLYIAALAGFVGAATSALSLYAWQMQIDATQKFYLLNVVVITLGALANVAYWYGLSVIGTRFHSSTLHYMALLALILSIFTDASNAVFTLFPQYAASSGWDAFGLFMSTLFAIAYILTGLAVQKLRSMFGDVALWYGIFAMVSGVIVLAGDFGIPAISALGMALNVVLYVLGGMILLQAAKR